MSIVIFTVWALVALFLTGTAIWLVLYALGRYYDEPERIWSAEDVQVRIITKGDHPQVTRRTANRAAEFFDDVRIVTDEYMEPAPQSRVHVVPESYESEAIRKGRAIDWATSHIDCDREYVLYLDEDTLVTGFDGLPDRDIVQFLETPQRTSSWLSWSVEVGRVGFQTEVRGFPYLTYPLYLWGGAFAVRASVEQSVGWNVRSVTEDTLFLWRASGEPYSYAVTNQWYENQAAPSVKSLISQRRRWYSGAIEALPHLPWRWKALVLLRSVIWQVSLLTVYVVAASSLTGAIPVPLGLLMLGVVVLWSALGAARYENWAIAFVGALVLFPLLHTLNAVGVLWGVLRPASDFAVTPKE